MDPRTLDSMVRQMRRQAGHTQRKAKIDDVGLRRMAGLFAEKARRSLEDIPPCPPDTLMVAAYEGKGLPVPELRWDLSLEAAAEPHGAAGLCAWLKDRPGPRRHYHAAMVLRHALHIQKIGEEASGVINAIEEHALQLIESEAQADRGRSRQYESPMKRAVRELLADNSALSTNDLLSEAQADAADCESAFMGLRAEGRAAVRFTDARSDPLRYVETATGKEKTISVKTLQNHISSQR